MVSIRESVDELDRAFRLRELTLECYVSAIQSISQYAVDLEDGITGAFKRHVAEVAAKAAEGEESSLEESRSTLRGLLREFRDKGSAYINDLREQFANSARALEEIMESMAQTDTDGDVRMRAALGRLRDLAARPECAPVQTALLASARAIESGLEQIKRQNQITITQFHAEIRVLHERIQSMEAAAVADEAGRLLSREEIEERIREAGSCPFSLLLIRAVGMKAADRQHDGAITQELLGSLAKRMRSGLPPEAAIGCWGDERYVAKIPLSKQAAITASRRLSETLTGTYTCMKEGKAVRANVQTSIAVVDREGDDPPARTIHRVNEFFRF